MEFMEPKVNFKLTFLILALALTSCSKFGRLSNAEKFTEVTLGGSRHSVIATPQVGGVMIWGLSADGERFALALDQETDQRTVRLKTGTWSFFSMGWTGSGRFEGSVRCAVNQQTLQGVPTTVALNLQPGQCGSQFGASAYFNAGSPLPLRLTTCRSSTLSLVTGGDDPDCTGAGNLGPFRSFKIKLNEFESTSGESPAVVQSLTTNCKVNANWASNQASLDIPSVQIPVGASGGSSPIDTTIIAYPDPTCSSSPVEFRFPKGLIAGSSFSTALFPGTSPASTSLFLLGPGPSVSSLSPSSGSWGGQTSIVLAGSALFTGTTVTLNSKPCAVTSSSSTSITCTTPHSLQAGAATIQVNNQLGVTTLAATTPFTYQEDSFGNAVDSDTLGATHNIVASANWSNANSLAARAGSASGNISNISLGTGYTELTMTSAFTASEFAVDDEVMWHVSASSATSACSTAGDLTAGKFNFGRITFASSPTIRITGTITSTANNTNIGATSRNSGDTFCLIQLVRVPNFKNLTIDTTSGTVNITKSNFSFANGHGGIIPLRVAGELTLTGSNNLLLFAKGIGYPGGAGATLPFQGASRLGLGLSNAAQMGNSDTGGAPGSTQGAGGGAGRGDGGNGGASTPAGKGIGVTDCSPALNCALFGGGGGGGSAAGANGGAGAGIVMLFAKTVAFSSFTGAFQLWIGGQEGLGSAGMSAGAGGGGTTYVTMQNASGVTLNIIGGGGHAAGGGGTVNGGGGGGGGLSLVRECFATKLTSLNSDISGGNPGIGSSFNGGFGSVGTTINDQISSGNEFCP